MPSLIPYSRRLAVFLPLAAVCLGSVAAVSATTAPETSQFCEITAVPQSGMVKLQAFAKGDANAGGSYSFNVEKTGGGGSSTISQGGDFTLGKGGPELLSSVMLDAKDARYKAVLDIDLGTKSVSCTKLVGDD